MDERRLTDDEIAQMAEEIRDHGAPIVHLWDAYRIALLVDEVKASRSVPASDPRALALVEAFEEACRADHGNGIAATERDALLAGLRALSGSESPRDQGEGP